MDDYLVEAKATGRQKKQKQKRKRSGQYTNDDPLIKFLRERICRLNYGTKLPDKVCPELTIKKLIAKYNECRYGSALKNDQFLDHFASRLTHYFWGDHMASSDEILVNIDIDACGHHGGGTTEGCWRFGEVVKDDLFPGLYLEPSTNGQGVHGYLRLMKLGIKGDLVRHALKNLDRYLKRLAVSVGADIACVEVKGLPPSIQYDDNGNITAITFGQWAKLPRGRGVLDTCKVNYNDIALLDPDEIKVEPEQEEVVEKATSKMRLGSFDSRVVRQETLDMMPELEKLSSCLLRQWTGATSFKAGRWTVTATDLAQFFALMLCIKPRPDESLAVRAVGRLWEEVYRAGDFTRPWNHHRFKAIRDLLSQHGHIDWVDFRFEYVPERKGRCCRWQISFSLRSLLSAVVKGETTVVDTPAPFADGPHEYHTPKWFNFTLDRQRRWLAEAEREVESMFAA